MQNCAAAPILSASLPCHSRQRVSPDLGLQVLGIALVAARHVRGGIHLPTRVSDAQLREGQAARPR